MTVKMWGRELDVTPEVAASYQESQPLINAAWKDARRKERNEASRQTRLAIKERKATGVIPPKPDGELWGCRVYDYVWDERNWEWKRTWRFEYDWSCMVYSLVQSYASYHCSSATLAKMAEIALQDKQFVIVSPEVV